MYYIVSIDQRYYAGKCYSDNETPVWENHYTRALAFDTIEKALNFAKEENIFFLGVEYKENAMNITTVVEIIRIDKQILEGVVSFSEEVVEVFDCTKGSSTADICQKALERCQELNTQHSNSCRSYVTNRVD